MIKAVIFDCFGVIVGKGFEYTYQMAGGDPTKDRIFIEDTLGQANMGLISEAGFNQAITDKLGITVEAWRTAERGADKPDVELLDYVEDLRRNHKTAILSNANKGVMSAKIGDANLERCFDEVIVSAEIGMVKPDPAIYEYTADLLGVDLSECVFIDDSEGHLIPARRLGMGTVLYQDFDQMKSEIEKLLANPKS